MARRRRSRPAGSSRSLTISWVQGRLDSAFAGALPSKRPRCGSKRPLAAEIEFLASGQPSRRSVSYLRDDHHMACADVDGVEDPKEDSE